jgi:DMSO reductase anchor subunit
VYLLHIIADLLRDFVATLIGFGNTDDQVILQTIPDWRNRHCLCFLFLYCIDGCALCYYLNTAIHVTTANNLNIATIIVIYITIVTAADIGSTIITHMIITAINITTDSSIVIRIDDCCAVIASIGDIVVTVIIIDVAVTTSIENSCARLIIFALLRSAVLG